LEFTSDFVEEIERKQGSIENLFSEISGNDALDIESRIQRHWKNPSAGSLNEDVSKYAVDGSRATRRFSNGSEMLVCRALMIGGDTAESEEYKKMFVDAYRGPGNPDVTRRYARMISHLMEIEVILENWDQIPENSVIYIDGSIHGRYLHSLWPFNLDGREDVPLKLLQSHIDLIEKADEKDVLLVGVSKTSQVRALAKEVGAEVPDAELLYKHTAEPGVSTPVVLGGYGFDPDEFEWLDTNPEKFAERIFTQSLSREEVLKTIHRLRDSPAVAMFHTRMDRNQETMRVDVPVNALGIEDTITSCKSRMIDHSHIQEVYSHVKQDYGGVKVYNSLLYMVDEMVRLNQETVDNVYLKIVKDELDTDVEITRSYRRFM
jgi:hypothetical protein